MKTKISFSLWLLVLSIFLNGCIQVETNIKVNKDGSGTIEEIVLMSNDVVKMLQEFAGTFGDSTETNSFKIFNEDELKQKAANYGEGVEYISGEELIKDNKQGFRVVYSFKDLNNISLSPDPENQISVGGEMEKTEPDNDQFKFSFIPGETPEVIITAKNKESSVESDETESEYGEISSQDSTFLEMMKEMKISMNVIFNGEIISTNSSYKENNKITLLGIDFGEIISNPEAFKKLNQKNPENFVEFKEIVKDIPGIKLEAGYPVSVTFK
jgi:hypothetical protein